MPSTVTAVSWLERFGAHSASFAISTLLKEPRACIIVGSVESKLRAFIVKISRMDCQKYRVLLADSLRISPSPR